MLPFNYSQPHLIPGHFHRPSLRTMLSPIGSGFGALLFLSVSGAATAQSLNPAQDIVLPASSSAKEPLEWLGANGPWFTGEFVPWSGDPPLGDG